MANCRWLQADNGEIIGALTQSGERSKLFDQLNEQFSKEDAVKYYAVSQSDDFQEIFTEEPTIENLLRYIANQNKTEEKLTKEQLVDLQDFSNFDREKLFSTFYDKNGLFLVSENKLTKSGLYSAYEAGTIINDVELQDRIKDALERLKNTSDEELQLVEPGQVTKLNEFNSFGKLATIEGISEGVNEGVNQNNEGVKQAEVFVQVGEEIRPKRNTETELILPITAKQTENQKVSDLNSISLEVLQNNQEETRQVLDEIENELIKDSIDVIGLSEKAIDENLKDFISVLDKFIKDPTAENTKDFADKADEYFNRDLSPKKENIDGEQNKEYVKLETNLSEEEVYNQQGLIKLDDNTYIKTAKEDLTTLYENVRTYTEKYPKNKTLEEHVQEQLKDYTYTNAETAEAIILYKMYFGVNNGLIKDKNGNLLAPNGKISNLNEEQWKLVRTPEFKAWFGDWENDPQNASKVVDDNGEPILAMHGTNANFNKFESRVGIRGNQFLGSREVLTDKFFFTDDLEYAEKASNTRTSNFGGKSNIIRAFINLRNPLDFTTFDYQTEEKFNEITGEYPSSYFGYNDNLDQWWRLFDNDEDDVTSIVKERGYDGVLLAEETKSIKDDKGYDIEVASVKSFGAFKSEQIQIFNTDKTTPTKQVSNFTGNYNYLTEEFPSDFYSKLLAEKKKNSKLFRNFYSNFEINEKGINLINKSETALRNIKIYADENLKQYSLISRQMPDLIEAEQSISNPRVEAINNPQKIKESKENLYKLNDQEIIIKNETEDFVKVNGEIYESVAKQGNLNHFVKLETPTSDYYAVEVKSPQTNLKLSDYNYLNESPEKFKSVKDFLKGENPDELQC